MGVVAVEILILIKAVFAHGRRLKVRSRHAGVLWHFFHDDIWIRIPNRIRYSAGIAALARYAGDPVASRAVEPDGNRPSRGRVETRLQRSAVFYQYGMCVEIDLRIAEGERAIPYVHVAINVCAFRGASIHDAIDPVG